MSGSVNKVILVGNLGKDPEIRSAQGGNRIANLSIATSETWKDKSTGERREKTEWHRVVIFNDKLVEVIEKYATKGMKVYIEGQLQTRKWADQSGADRYSTEVVLQNFKGTFTMLSDARSGLSEPEDENQDRGGRVHGAASAGTHGGSGAADLDDDIPF